MYKTPKVIDASSQRKNYFFLILLIIVLASFTAMNLHLILNLKQENAELKEAVDAMIDSQNKLIDSVDEEVKYMQSMEKRMCEALSSGNCK